MGSLFSNSNIPDRLFLPISLEKIAGGWHISC